MTNEDVVVQVRLTQGVNQSSNSDVNQETTTTKGLDSGKLRKSSDVTSKCQTWLLRPLIEMRKSGGKDLKQ